MSSVLIQNFIEQSQCPVLDESNIDAFLSQHDEVILFFTENPERFPEGNDVVVILPEIVKYYENRFEVAVISQASQRKLQSRYAFTEWPSLVFIRNGKYLGVISRVQNWSDYIEKVDEILAGQAKHNPGLGVPVTVEAFPSNTST